MSNPNDKGGNGGVDRTTTVDLTDLKVAPDVQREAGLVVAGMMLDRRAEFVELIDMLGIQSPEARETLQCRQCANRKPVEEFAKPPNVRLPDRPYRCCVACRDRDAERRSLKR